MGRSKYLAVLELLLGDLPEGVDLVALQLQVVRVRVRVRALVLLGSTTTYLEVVALLSLLVELPAQLLDLLLELLRCHLLPLAQRRLAAVALALLLRRAAA